MIPYSRPKHSDLYTLSSSKLPENHTPHSGTYLYSPYMAVPSRGLLLASWNLFWEKHESLLGSLAAPSNPLTIPSQQGPIK